MPDDDGVVAADRARGKNMYRRESMPSPIPFTRSSDTNSDAGGSIAQQANAHDFIMALPHGYGTMVAERGTTLSGGQRRRIAIARALVRDTPILVLDEPTTGLDAASEYAVTEALERLMKGRTCIVVAHHLNTICRADVIFVVEDTAVVERGTHEQLLATGGLYSELYEMQRRHGPKTLTI